MTITELSRRILGTARATDFDSIAKFVDADGNSCKSVGASRRASRWQRQRGGGSRSPLHVEHAANSIWRGGGLGGGGLGGGLGGGGRGGGLDAGGLAEGICGDGQGGVL